MSEILNEALLGEIKRLRAINIEGLGASIQRLENTSKENQRMGREVKENVDQLGKRIAEVNVPAEIKLTRHLTIGANDRYFVTILVFTFLLSILSASAIMYAISKNEKLEKSQQIQSNQSDFIEWMRKEKGGEGMYQKYMHR